MLYIEIDSIYIQYCLYNSKEESKHISSLYILVIFIKYYINEWFMKA